MDASDSDAEDDIAPRSRGPMSRFFSSDDIGGFGMDGAQRESMGVHLISPSSAMIVGYGGDVNRLSEAWRNKIDKKDQERLGKKPKWFCPFSDVHC